MSSFAVILSFMGVSLRLWKDNNEHGVHLFGRQWFVFPAYFYSDAEPGNWGGDRYGSVGMGGLERRWAWGARNEAVLFVQCGDPEGRGQRRRPGRFRQMAVLSLFVAAMGVALVNLLNKLYEHK
jgi:hypothetical protein